MVILKYECFFRCPTGRWGENCEKTCECANGAGCHHVTGHCQCEAGFIGEKVNMFSIRAICSKVHLPIIGSCVFSYDFTVLIPLISHCGLLYLRYIR